ncbi:MAG: SDR family oxidoreductase [Gammaproteobacteria bacterium]|nr:SDR family oxidoreductase [Gammaproteobacteria bacterium]
MEKRSGRDARDPREVHARPPYPAQQQAPPGREADMRPLADHGEESYVGHGRLRDRVALITGADSGIGRAVALAYAREGADVLISYLDEDDDANETARLVRDAKRRAVTMPGDIGNESHAETLIRRCIDEFGRLDILVNNAAYQSTHERIEDISASELEHTFRTNVFGMFHLCKAALPLMKPGSVIINTASIQAYQPKPSLLAYASTKGAIVTFSKALAMEAIERGIRVNVVAPGPVWTPLIPSTMPAESVKEFGQSAPMGRAAQPAELAPTYVFLASEDSSYITGEIFGVGGGKFFG